MLEERVRRGGVGRRVRSGREGASERGEEVFEAAIMKDMSVLRRFRCSDIQSTR